MQLGSNAECALPEQNRRMNCKQAPSRPIHANKMYVRHRHCCCDAAAAAAAAVSPAEHMQQPEVACGLARVLSMRHTQQVGQLLHLRPAAQRQQTAFVRLQIYRCLGRWQPLACIPSCTACSTPSKLDSFSTCGQWRSINKQLLAPIDIYTLCVAMRSYACIRSLSGTLTSSFVVKCPALFTRPSINTRKPQNDELT
jgi:hypothetical protein